MTDVTESLIEWFDKQRNKFYEERKSSDISKKWFLSQKRTVSLEKDFADSFLMTIDKGLTARSALPDEPNWHGIVLHLKNEIEGVGYSVDYLNYFHTFLAVFFAVAMSFAITFKDFGGLLIAAIVFGFIVYAFVKRSEMRNKILKYKTLLNILEYQKALANSAKKSTEHATNK